MTAATPADMAKCRFITLYPPPGLIGNGGFEAFIWTQTRNVPPCDVEYVAKAIRRAHAEGSSFYLFFQHVEPRDRMKISLEEAGIVAAQAVLQ